LSEKGVLA